MLFTTTSSSVDSTSQPGLPQSHLHRGRWTEDRDTLVNNINIIKLRDEDGDNEQTGYCCLALRSFRRSPWKTDPTKNNDPNGDASHNDTRSKDYFKQQKTLLVTATAHYNRTQSPTSCSTLLLVIACIFSCPRQFPLATSFHFRSTPFPSSENHKQNDAIERVFAFDQLNDCGFFRNLSN